MPTSPSHRQAARVIRAAGEAVALALAILSVWPLASAGYVAEFVVTAGVALLALLWTAYTAVTGSFTFKPDVVSTGLTGVLVVSAVQLVPLPEGVVGVLSPNRLAWHREFQPSILETLPGETPVPRPTWLPLTVCADATRSFVAQVAAALILYAAARHWLATRDSFRRLAWAATANGVLLALVGLAQFVSSPDKVLWTFDRPGAASFGPFVCRNHYPDYIAFCIGLAGGLGMVRGPSDRVGARQPLLSSPRAVGLAAACGLMQITVPFSLSRGGMAATLVAAVGVWRLAGGGGGRLATWVLAGLVGLAFAGYVGFGAVEDRLSTVASGQVALSRFPMWRDAVTLVPGGGLSGCGAGGFQWAELTVRSSGWSPTMYDSAHNEYLEAVVEGGPVRLGFTVLAAVGVLAAVWGGATRMAARSTGPLVTGAWFGLAVLVFHNAGDFGVRIPAVAALAAVVAGYAMAASFDPGFAPTKRGQKETDPDATYTGVTAVLAAATVAIVAGAAAVEAYARTGPRPGDPVHLADAAGAYFDAGNVPTGLTLARASRSACPLHPKAQYLLGRHADGFATGEPAAAHFERAKRLGRVDSFIRYESGRAAWAAGNTDAAWADFRASLDLGGGYLKQILELTRGEPAERLVPRLPADPQVLMAAADLTPADRRPLVAAAAAIDRPNLTAAQLDAAARGLAELDRPEAADRWQRALAALPDDMGMHDRLARYYEQRERYADAIPHLERLTGRHPGREDLADRLAAARHGVMLAKELGQ